MPRGAKKGEKRGSGRPKGSPNKSTKELREMITLVLNKEFANLDKMLHEIGEENGKKAKFDSICKLIGYALPQLKASELSMGDNQSIKIEIKKTK